MRAIPLILASALAATPVAAVNLVSNGSFEAGLAGAAIRRRGQLVSA